MFVNIYFSIWYYIISYCAQDYIESLLIVFVYCSILYILLSYIYLLYPPKGICESRPQGPNGSTWQSFHFNMWLANENWVFNFELVIRRKNSAQNLYPPKGSVKAHPMGSNWFSYSLSSLVNEKWCFNFELVIGQKILAKNLYCAGGRIDAWMDKWMDGWTDGWTGGRWSKMSFDFSYFDLSQR